MGASLAAFVEPCPTGTRLLGALYAATSGSLGALALSDAGRRQMARLLPHFLCTWRTVVTRKYYWAALTSLFFRPATEALDLVIAWLELQWATEHLTEQERRLGSTRFVGWCLLVTGLGNGAFLALMRYLSSTGVRGAEQAANQGLWPIVTVCMTLRALELPDVEVSVLGMAKVPNRWYPLSLAIGLSAMRGMMQWDMLTSIACGHAVHSLKVEERFLFGRRLAASLEQLWLPRVPRALTGLLGGYWVPAGSTRRPPDDAAGPRGGWGGWGQQQQQSSDAGRGGGGGGGNNLRLFGGPGRRLSD